ncbi:MAG: protein kinase [Planctomycetota bacterium]|nr:protein kinase [Planctomycetota bacterium]
MNQNQQQASLIVEWKWLPQDLINNALNALPAHPGIDLCQFLVLHSYLDPGRAEQVRYGVVNHQSHFATQVHASGSSQSMPSALFNSLTPQSEVLETLKADRGRAQQYYEAVHARDPLFSPHVKCTLKRLSVLGKGGMGTVYEVEDTRLGRRAAFKVISGDSGDDEATFRFLREARLSAKLDHPAIPPVYEAGTTHEGELYLLMRLIRGRTLKEHIRSYHSGGRKRGVLVKLLECFIKICEAVAYAHSQGILHRDLKPSNVMVGPFGEVMVLDWGLARDIKDPDSDRMIQAQCSLKVDSELFSSQGLTKAGFILGTPGYMSPEQAEGQDTDVRTDVYGLGAILYEILSNETPVMGKTVMNVILDTIQGKVPDILKKQSDCPRELAEIVRSSLSRSLKERTESAAVMAEDMSAYLRGEPVSVYSYNLAEKTRRWIVNHPMLLVITTAFVLLSSVLVIATLTVRDQELQAEKARLKSDQEKSMRRAAESEQRIAEQDAAIARGAQEAIEKRAAKLEESLRLLASARVIAGRKGAKKELDAVLNEALSIGNGKPTMLRMAGEIYEIADRIEAAERCYLKAFKKSPNDYEVLYCLYLLMGKKGAQKKRDQYSRQILALAKERNEDVELSLYFQGLAEQRKGNNLGAIEYYNRSETMSTRSAALYINRGAAYSALKRYKEAREDYLKALKIEPKESRAYRNLARVNIYMGNLGEALYHLTCALTLNSKDAQAHDMRGGIYYRQRDFVSLVVECDQLLKLDPKNMKAYNWKTYALVEMKDYSRAILWAKKGLRIDARQHRIYYYMGVAHYYKKDYSQSLATLNKAAQLQSNDYLVYMFRARAYDQLKQDKQAEQDFSRALKLKKSLKVIRYRTYFYVDRDRHEEALADLKYFDSNQKYWPEYRYFRANVYLKMGEKDKARAELQQFLRLNPSSKYAKNARIKLRALSQ